MTRMAMIYIGIAVFVLSALVLVPQALHRAHRIERLTSDDVARARELTERNICYDCGGPILGVRQEKRLFDLCEKCGSSD
jgi:hypothetical protein